MHKLVQRTNCCNATWAMLGAPHSKYNPAELQKATVFSIELIT